MSTTANTFRRIALGMKGAIERAHMDHPDFRAHGRIFATLHRGDRTGMVKLTPGDQQRLMGEHPAAFAPSSGAWGRAGCTQVTLRLVDEETLGEALTLAWRTSAAHAAKPKRPPRRR